MIGLVTGRYNPYRTKPTQKWIEAIPCGNGTLGAMAYGGPHELIFSMDRSDLWCKNPGQINRRMTAGALVLQCPATNHFAEGLNLLEAVAFRETSSGRLEWFVHAESPFLCVRIQRPGERSRFVLQPPNLWNAASTEAAIYRQRLGGKKGKDAGDPYAGRTRTLCAVRDHVAAMTFVIDSKDHVRTSVRAYRNGTILPISMEEGGFSIVTGQADEILLLVKVTLLDRKPIPESLPMPHWTVLLESHRKWWRDFWSRSGVRLSNSVVDKLWCLGNYHLGSNCRKDSLPMVLQGVWGVDGMPPWNGAYTWDLNVQTCYWPIYAGNHLELGHSLYDWYLKKLPLWRDYARTMMKADGAAMVLQTDDEGVSAFQEGILGPADGAWVCHNFWQHYVHTGDREFLHSHGLPVFREHLKFAGCLWKKGQDGRYHIEHAASPELTMLATPEHPCRDTSYEIACAKFLAWAYLQTVECLGIGPDDLSGWARDFLANIVDYPTAATAASNYYWPEDPAVPEYFVEWPGLETQMSHRHFNHLMMLYPFGEIHRFSPYRTLRTAQNSIHMLTLRGQGGWAGFSFPWASLLSTRVAWPKRMPLHMLEAFARNVVISFNGLTLNEDYLRLGAINQTGPFGPFHLENFTLESSMIAMTAVQEMLLHRAGEHLVFGGGMPPELDGEFWGLRTPLGDVVSGKIEGGKLTAAELRSERSGSRLLALDNAPANWEIKNGKNTFRQTDCSLVSLSFKEGEQYSLKRL